MEGNKKPSKVSKIKLLDKNDNLISQPKKIANIFNDHFATNGSNIEQRIPHASGNFKDYFSKNDNNGNLLLNPTNSFFLSPTVPAKVEKLIDALNIKKSTGPCSINVFILKLFKPFFALWLSKLANLGFTNGIFPDIIKTAQVTPTHKKERK